MRKKTGAYNVSAMEEMHKANYVYKMEEPPSLRQMQDLFSSVEETNV